MDRVDTPVAARLPPQRNCTRYPCMITPHVALFGTTCLRSAVVGLGWRPLAACAVTDCWQLVYYLPLVGFPLDLPLNAMDYAGSSDARYTDRQITAPGPRVVYRLNIVANLVDVGTTLYRCSMTWFPVAALRCGFLILDRVRGPTTPAPTRIHPPRCSGCSWALTRYLPHLRLTWLYRGWDCPYCPDF